MLQNNNLGEDKKATELGKAIFKAFKEQSLDQWIALYPTNDEYQKVLEVGLAAKVEGLTREKIDEMIVRRKKEAFDVYKAEFMSYLKMADSAGVNWQLAKFDRFSFDAVYPEEVKLKYLNGDIWFSCGASHFIIGAIQAVEIPVGYRLQSMQDIKKVSAIGKLY